MKNQAQIPTELEQAGGCVLPDEVSNAMEMMKRIKAVNNVRSVEACESQGAFTYSLPQPVYLCQAIG
jgi:hypothetical protein